MVCIERVRRGVVVCIERVTGGWWGVLGGYKMGCGVY